MGKLFVCGTPIGNLKDITLRCLETLKDSDIIYAEDTRQTVKLLNYYEIKKPLKSYHEHNKFKIGPKIVEDLLKEDIKVVLVSDAGMPGISDPGEELIKDCIINNIDFEIIPGPTAFTTAVVGSGLSTKAFNFEGFLNRNKKGKREQIEKLNKITNTIILYESPHRIKDTLKDLLAGLGDRKIVIARELTKRYEEYIRGSISEVLEDLSSRDEIRGEMVIVIEGGQEVEEENILEQLSIESHLEVYINRGMSKNQAIKLISKERNMDKKEVYKLFAND